MASQLMLEGLERSSLAHKDSLNVARLIAEMTGHFSGETVTIDDVFKWISPKALGAAAGNVFRYDSWEFVAWVESRRESNHSRPVRAWKLRASR